MNKIEYILICINSIIGTAITIEDARNWLGIIILLLQLILIIKNVSIKIYKRIKNKEYQYIDDDIKDAIDDIQEIKEGKK